VTETFIYGNRTMGDLDLENWDYWCPQCSRNYRHEPRKKANEEKLRLVWWNPCLICSNRLGEMKVVIVRLR
jgi:hypothetical protein